MQYLHQYSAMFINQDSFYSFTIFSSPLVVVTRLIQGWTASLAVAGWQALRHDELALPVQNSPSESAETRNLKQHRMNRWTCWSEIPRHRRLEFKIRVVGDQRLNGSHGLGQGDPNSYGELLYREYTVHVSGAVRASEKCRPGVQNLVFLGFRRTGPSREPVPNHCGLVRSRRPHLGIHHTAVLSDGLHLGRRPRPSNPGR